MNDVVITIGAGGLGRRQPSTDMVCGLICGGVNAVSGPGVVARSYKLLSLSDAEALGFDAALDVSESILIHHHVSEFFRLNPDGELWLRLAPQGTSMEYMVDPARTHLKQLLIDANGAINVAGCVLNPAGSYSASLSGGLDGDVLDAIPMAQSLIDSEWALHRPLRIVIEGRELNGTVSSATDLRTLDCEGVSVVIAQDPSISALDSLYEPYAAVGTVLGAISRAKVNENIGWVAKFNLSDAASGRFLSAGLSNNGLVSSLTSSQENYLNTAGYITVRTHAGRAGVYFNDSHTCTDISSDFAYIENGRVIDKATRLIRAALLPYLNSPLLVDGATGRLKLERVNELESVGRQALEVMANDQEISALDVFIDPAQDVLANSSLAVKIDIIPTGIARQISVTLGFVNPF